MCPSRPQPLQRYQHYITTGISSAVLSSLPLQQLSRILLLLPPDTERSSVNLPAVRADVQEEARRDYHLSMKKSIGRKTTSVRGPSDLEWFSYIYINIHRATGFSLLLSCREVDHKIITINTHTQNKQSPKCDMPNLCL